MLLAPLGVAFNLFFADAQESQSQVDRGRQLLREQMELKLNQMELVSSGEGDEDLGSQILIQRKPKPWTLSLSSDIGEVWNSNVMMASSELASDFAWTYDETAGFSFRLMDELTLNAGYRYSAYRYHRLITQNFDAHNGTMSLNYSLPYQFNLWSGVGWTSVYSRPVDDSVYEEGDWNIGFNKVFPLNIADWAKDRLASFVGYQTDLRQVSPVDYDRIEYSPFTGVYYQALSELVLQGFYRWQYQNYMNGGRKDTNHMLNGSITWTPLDWLSVTGFCGYLRNDSVNSTRDYRAYTTGGNLKLNWKF